MKLLVLTSWSASRNGNAYWLAFVILLAAGSGLARDLNGKQESSSTSYHLEVDLNYRGASFKGRERIQFTNTTREEMDGLFFYLYPNAGLQEEDRPWLVVHQVRLNTSDLRFNMRAHNTLLKAELPQKLASGQSIELTIEFSGALPKIQREESSLLAHFLQEVNDAVSDERQQKDARDIFFASEEAMLLGYFYPVLSMRPQQSPEQSTAVGVGAIATSDIADYDVVIKVDEGVTVIASGKQVGTSAMPQTKDETSKRLLYHFRGQSLRGFGVALAERVKSAERKVGEVRVVSYFRESDERLGYRALNIAANAVECYVNAFGAYPYPQLQVAEMPLPAGYSGIEFPMLVVLAQAYFIDFDSPQSARLPGVLREQADVIRSSFEFTLAHSVAKQWWGGVVGSEPDRAPFLDEALATYAAAYYHEVMYGKQLGELVIDQQLRGAYQAYRMLGGADIEVDRPAKEFRNAIQYTAIVQAKAALLLVALRKQLGDESFFTALRRYYTKHRFRVASPDHLRFAFLAESVEPRQTRALFQQWLKEKRGDEEIGAPDLTLAPPPVSKIRALGRVFVKIGRTAAKPF